MGQFLDSEVSGLEYSSATRSGITDENGLFRYLDGESVSFRIGDIDLGTASGAPIVTPMELTSGPATVNNQTAINIATFLLSLDSDADPSDGIEITEAVRNAAVNRSVDFKHSGAMFRDLHQALVNELTAAQGKARDLIGELEALAHLRATLLKLYAGTYGGTVSGSDSGNWTLTINDNGIVSGAVCFNTAGAFAVDGTIDMGGGIAFAGVNGEFFGNATRDGELAGTWEGNPAGTGMFEGSSKTTVDCSASTSIMDFDFTLYDDFSVPGSVVWGLETAATAGSSIDIGNGVALITTVKDSAERIDQGLWLQDEPALSDYQAFRAEFRIVDATGTSLNRAQILLGLFKETINDVDYTVDTGINLEASGTVRYFIEIFNNGGLEIEEIASGVLGNVDPQVVHTLTVAWDGVNFAFQVDADEPVLVPMDDSTAVDTSANWRWAAVRATSRGAGTGSVTVEIDNVYFGAME